MSKKLEEMVQSISDMSEADLLERVRQIRRNKYEVKPAKRAIVKKEVGGELKKLLKGLSKEDQISLLSQIKGE